MFQQFTYKNKTYRIRTTLDLANSNEIALISVQLIGEIQKLADGNNRFKDTYPILHKKLYDYHKTSYLYIYLESFLSKAGEYFQKTKKQLIDNLCNQNIRAWKESR